MPVCSFDIYIKLLALWLYILQHIDIISTLLLQVKFEKLSEFSFSCEDFE